MRFTTQQTDHYIYRTRRAADATPLPHGAGIKGSIRAAYEAITNSRFGVFRGHDVPLARRMQPAEAAQLKPARINAGQIEILSAAWVPAYGHENKLGSLPHGTPVTAVIYSYRHTPRNNRPRTSSTTAP